MVLSVFWVFLYFIQGTYLEMRRMFRLKMLNLTISGSIIGSLIIFFAIILDDQVRGYEGYYWNLLILFCVHFLYYVLIQWHRSFSFVTILIFPWSFLNLDPCCLLVLAICCLSSLRTSEALTSLGSTS